MRDMAVTGFKSSNRPESWGLPNRANQLAAQALGPRLAVAHDALARAHDGDAQAVKYRLQLVVSSVEAASRPAGAIQAADDFFAFGAVLEENPQRRLRAGDAGLGLERRL